MLIGIDTGGTFTDFVLFDGGRLRVLKIPSTPENPARAVLDGIRELCRDAGPAQRRGAASPAQITYGSTVATNALLERKGARVVLLTTAGFEDVLEIGRQIRPALYALEPTKPEPLVPAHRRIGVDERMSFEGEALRPLSGRALRSCLRAVRRLEAQSVAVCLLHSYTNPSHERAIGSALRRLGIPCSLSHELLAEYREYERTSTTTINAYVAPVMSGHLGDLQRGIGRARLRVMQSNGGAVSVATASREAIRTLLSGPAAGVIGARAAAQRAGLAGLITFDMGGTSTDVSLMDRDARYQTEWQIDELPVRIPAIDIHTVGAGGGSIAYRDAGGALKVGPESAGADPGPACYGRGTKPTVTDADVVLGRLVPDAFLGGRMTLAADRSVAALRELGRSLGLTTEEAAEGVVRVVVSAMERAIRRISVERGHDPRGYALVAFGGAAGMHACELATALGITRVLVPSHPGLLSAWGALAADVQRDYVQTIRRVNPPVGELRRILAPLQERARREARAEAPSARRVTIAALLDVRYRGQSYELTIPMSSAYPSRFHAEHQRMYGYADPQRDIEVVNVRLLATAQAGVNVTAPVERRAASSSPRAVRWRGRWWRGSWFERSGLPRRPTPGPAVVTELSATTFIPPGWVVRVLESGDLLLESREG